MAVAAVPVRFHISLNVSDLEGSVGFYRVLFGSDPAKLRHDYAKFESDDPPLVLSLEPTPPAHGIGPLNHLGLRLGDSAALVDVQRRFEAAGIRTQREEGVECCYALQTKFWVTDPDQNLWELYVLHEDLDHRGAGQTREQMLPGASQPQKPAAPRGAKAVVWQHTLGMELPQRLPCDDSSTDEVRLLGTFNVAMATGTRDQLLAEVVRILKPGGKLMVHTLVANRPPQGKLNLPGPAALVQAVPVDEQLFAAIEQAGVAGITLEKFGSAPCFMVDGVEMRELKLWASKPADAEDDPHSIRQVLYKGPLKQVQDETGNTYPRGKRVNIDARQWSQLKGNPAAESFVFFESSPAGRCSSEPLPVI